MEHVYNGYMLTSDQRPIPKGIWITVSGLNQPTNTLPNKHRQWNTKTIQRADDSIRKYDLKCN
jgi:hypothetical protein